MPSPQGHVPNAADATARPDRAATPDGHAARPAPTIAEVVNAVFSRYDADADGSITLTEVLNVVDPSGKYSDLVARVTSLASTLDGDANGKLSKDELTTAVTALDTDHNGSLERGDLAATKAAAGTTGDDLGLLLRPHPSPSVANDPPVRTLAEVVAGLFDKVDADNSSTITLPELLTLVDGAGKAIDFTAMATGLFTQIDSDADGVLSTDEVSAAVTLLDTNQDGNLGSGDLAPEQFDQQSVELIGLLVHGFGGHGHGHDPDGAGGVGGAA